MKDNFVAFWSKAKGKPFETQMTLWDQIIEAPHQGFYDSLVWNKKFQKNWKEKKAKRLKETFAFYRTHASTIKKEFERFPEVLKFQVKNYKKIFPDSKFDFPIYASVAPTFNGKAAELKSKQVLAFGIDTMVKLNDNANTLYAHELFHMYHYPRLELDEDGMLTEKFTMNLWLEGFATYVSHRMHKDVPMHQVFMSEKLAAIRQTDLSELSKLFLLAADTPAINPKDLSHYRDWFVYKRNLNSKFPDRMGYWLGFKVVDELDRRYPLEEMVNWKPSRVHTEVKTQLRRFVK